ncbi:MAG: hypothetical protein QG563_509 [Patescibacteria group bacterium]|nr:hypothetical protein [Patescibacteria group bacterium]
MKILSIETSCDETAISILEVKGGDSSPVFTILSDKLVSQIDIHREFGGVFPAIAKREHAKAIFPLFISALKESNLLNSGTTSITQEHIETLQKLFTHEQELCELFIQEISKIEKPDLDCIAVTTGPGLEPALWVGVNFARALSYIWDIPIVPVNHMEGHVMSVVAQQEGNTFTSAKIEFPALSLLVSGGHTELVLIRDWMNYEKIGQTKDDALGEAFDKVARILGLPYPGGPEISKITKVSRPLRKDSRISLPRPMIHSGDYNFSYSGLKTAVLYTVRDIGELTEDIKNEIAVEFEDSAIEVLVKKTVRAVEEYNIRTVMVGGGVANNSHLQTELKQAVEKYDASVALYFPRVDFSTDNSLMIGVAGYYQFLKNNPISPDGERTKKGTNVFDVRANGNWSL